MSRADKPTLTFNDIIHDLNNQVRSVDIAPMKKRSVLKRYFELMQQAVVTGHQWNFPDESGTMAVIKDANSVDKGILRTHGNKDVYAFDELNNSYSIRMTSKTMDGLRYNYIPFKQFTEQVKEKVQMEDCRGIYRTQFT